MKNILYTHVSSSSIHRKNNSRASAEEFDDTGYFTKCLYVATYIVALLVCALVKKIKLVLLKSIHTHIPYIHVVLEGTYMKKVVYTIIQTFKHLKFTSFFSTSTLTLVAPNIVRVAPSSTLPLHDLYQAPPLFLDPMLADSLTSPPPPRS